MTSYPYQDPSVSNYPTPYNCYHEACLHVDLVAVGKCVWDFYIEQFISHYGIRHTYHSRLMMTDLNCKTICSNLWESVSWLLQECASGIS